MSFESDVSKELARARGLFPQSFHSCHEGYAVLLEEVDEVWDIVKQKQSKRNYKQLYAELVQVAVICQQFAEDINEKYGVSED